MIQQQDDETYMILRNSVFSTTLTEKSTSCLLYILNLNPLNTEGFWKNSILINNFYTLQRTLKVISGRCG